MPELQWLSSSGWANTNRIDRLMRNVLSLLEYMRRRASHRPARPWIAIIVSQNREPFRVTILVSVVEIPRTVKPA
jgi:hypothetical protein